MQMQMQFQMPWQIEFQSHKVPASHPQRVGHRTPASHRQGAVVHFLGAASGIPARSRTISAARALAICAAGPRSATASVCRCAVGLASRRMLRPLRRQASSARACWWSRRPCTTECERRGRRVGVDASVGTRCVFGLFRVGNRRPRRPKGRRDSSPGSRSWRSARRCRMSDRRSCARTPSRTYMQAASPTVCHTRSRSMPGTERPAAAAAGRGRHEA